MVSASAKRRQKSKAAAAAQPASSSEAAAAPGSLIDAPSATALPANRNSSGTSQHLAGGDQKGTSQSLQQESFPPSSAPKAKLPKVSINSLKRTASPGPQTTRINAANTTATAHSQVIGNSPSHNSAADGTTAAVTTKRQKSSPGHEKSENANPLASTNEHTRLRPAASSVSADEQMAEQLAQKLADAPGPAIKNQKPGNCAQAYIPSHLPSSAPTPSQSPAKAPPPDRSYAELADITKAVSLLEQSNLSARAAAFLPQKASRQHAPSATGKDYHVDSLSDSDLSESDNHTASSSASLNAPSEGCSGDKSMQLTIPESSPPVNGELPQRSQQRNIRRNQGGQRREAGPSRLSRTTFTDPDSNSGMPPGTAPHARTSSFAAFYKSQNQISEGSINATGRRASPHQTHRFIDNAPAIHAGPMLTSAGHASPGVASTAGSEISTIVNPPTPAYMANISYDDSHSPHSSFSDSHTFSADPVPVPSPDLLALPHEQPFANANPEVMDAGYGQVTAVPASRHLMVSLALKRMIRLSLLPS